MKKETKPIHILRNSCIALLAAGSFLIISTGCNAGKDKKDAVSTDTNSTTSTTSSTVTGSPEKAALAGTPIPFYTLKLDSASLVVLFADNKVIKIIVQVIDSNVTNEGLDLIAYGVNNKNEKATGPVGFTALSNPVTTFPTGPIVMGDQELTIKDLKDILLLTKKKGIIDPKSFHTLKFVPARDGTNKHLFYTVTQLGDDDTDGAGTTNPSPPAYPCTICDYN